MLDLDATERRRGLEGLIARAQGNARALAELSRLLRSDGLKERAADLAARALALAPDDRQVRAIAGETMSADVPSWHFLIVRDERRNLAYEEALRRAVTPGTRVLEIGTGTGLLAMMAARAGAAHVFSCEMEPVVALAARDVIARNGLSERITVLSKRSTDVQPAELGGPADILVSEIVSNNLLAEGVLPTIADAMARLVKPGGRVIPARGRVRVALAHEARMESRRIGVVSSFDLSPFNRLASPSYKVVVGSPHLQLRSDAADLFDFDFQSGGPWSNRRRQIEVRAHDGPINGIVQWIALDMDEIGRYENRPGPETTSAWAALFHPFPAPIDHRPDQTCAIFAHQDGTSLRVWGDLASSVE